MAEYKEKHLEMFDAPVDNNWHETVWESPECGPFKVELTTTKGRWGAWGKDGKYRIQVQHSGLWVPVPGHTEGGTPYEAKKKISQEFSYDLPITGVRLFTPTWSHTDSKGFIVAFTGGEPPAAAAAKAAAGAAAAAAAAKAAAAAAAAAAAPPPTDSSGLTRYSQNFDIIRDNQWSEVTWAAPASGDIKVCLVTTQGKWGAWGKDSQYKMQMQHAGAWVDVPGHAAAGTAYEATPRLEQSFNTADPITGVRVQTPTWSHKDSQGELSVTTKAPTREAILALSPPDDILGMWSSGSIIYEITSRNGDLYFKFLEGATGFGKLEFKTDGATEFGKRGWLVGEMPWVGQDNIGILRLRYNSGVVLSNWGPGGPDPFHDQIVAERVAEAKVKAMREAKATADAEAKAKRDADAAKRIEESAKRIAETVAKAKAEAAGSASSKPKAKAKAKDKTRPTKSANELAKEWNFHKLLHHVIDVECCRCKTPTMEPHMPGKPVMCSEGFSTICGDTVLAGAEAYKCSKCEFVYCSDCWEREQTTANVKNLFQYCVRGMDTGSEKSTQLKYDKGEYVNQVDRAQFQQMMRMYGVEMTDKEFNTLHDAVDSNRDGLVEVKDVLDFLFKD